MRETDSDETPFKRFVDSCSNRLSTAEAFSAQSIAREQVKNYELRPQAAIKVEQVNLLP